MATLTFVRRARELGFSMAKVRELLALSDHNEKPCLDADLLVQQQLAEVERKIADLSALDDELGQTLRSCQADKIGECQIIWSLGRHAIAWGPNGRPVSGVTGKESNGRNRGANLPLCL